MGGDMRTPGEEEKFLSVDDLKRIAAALFGHKTHANRDESYGIKKLPAHDIM